MLELEGAGKTAAETSLIIEHGAFRTSAKSFVQLLQKGPSWLHTNLGTGISLSTLDWSSLSQCTHQILKLSEYLQTD